MPAQASVALTDATPTTPVVHTFTPNGALQQPDRKVVAEWVARAAYEVGNQTIQETLTPPNGNGYGKRRIKISRPVLEQVAGVSGSGFTPPPTLAYENWIEVVIHTHRRSTPQERKDLVYMAGDYLTEATTRSTVETNERYW
jgi:hypothetical protein